ncbi:MAG: zf-HC2 domain-containing protein [Clostridia bacterium]|nr:zf-HC2 domain-containing protein [Clostridia bacterium]
MAEKCSIIRDLMPLCIDGTASEESKKRVEKHLAGCAPCETMYNEMKAAVEISVPENRENPEFVRAVKTMKNRRKRRIWLWMLLGVVLTLALVFAGFAAYYWYFEQPVQVMPEGFTFSQSPDGVGMMNVRSIPRSAQLCMEIIQHDRDGDGTVNHEAYAYFTATRAQMRQEGYSNYYFIIGAVEDNMLYMSRPGHSPVQIGQVVHGTEAEGGTVIYVAGGSIAQVAMHGLSIKSPSRVVWQNEQVSSVQFLPFTTLPPMITSDTVVYVAPTPMPASTSVQAVSTQAVTPLATPVPEAD